MAAATLLVMDTALAQVIEATAQAAKRRRDLARELDQVTTQMRQGMWDAHNAHGASCPAVARELSARLVALGVPLVEQDGLGVSHDTVRRYAEPKARPE